MQKILSVVLVLWSLNIYSQWIEHTVNDNAEFPQKLLTGFVDSDPFIDIVVLEQSSDSYNWYSNTGGTGMFGPPISIGSINEPRFMVLDDLNGDDNPDLLVSTPFTTPPNLAWFENDNSGNFGPIIEIPTPTTPEGEAAIAIADIDNDGDNDLVVGSVEDINHPLAWHENVDGNGTFGAANLIINDYVKSSALAVGDVDGDGDLDICVKTTDTGFEAWFENLDGQGNFGPPIEFGLLGQGVVEIRLADLDGDGDLDLVGGGFFSLIWWENLDGNGTFSDDIVIDPTPFTDIFPVDLDNDGDMDILRAVSSALPEGKIEWYENLDGNGNFSPSKLIDNLSFPSSISAADFDNDGDMDPISLSQDDDTIIWYENTLLRIEDQNFISVHMYPNPAEDVLHVQSATPIVKTTFYDVLGRELMSVDEGFEAIDVSSLPSGLLLVEIETTTGKSVQIIIRE